MKLLCFAHRNEAKTFFDRLKLSPLDTSLNLFKSKNEFILISGEGIQSTTELLSIVLSKYENISEIINYGIAGSLDKSLKENSIFSIRTVYQYFDDFSFKSHTSHDKQATIDLISVHKRIYSPEDKLKLSIYAHLLDMETWALASVAKRFKKKWKSYKTVSDSLDEATKCQQIANEAKFYSDLFWNHFINTKEQSPLSESSRNLILENSSLYFTHTQAHQIRKYCKSLILRDPSFLESFTSSKKYKSIVESEKSRKEKSKEVLNLLATDYDPITFKELQRTQKVFKSLKNQYLNFDHSEYIEKNSIKFKGQFKSSNDLRNIIRTLEKINIDELKGKSKDV